MKPEYLHTLDPIDSVIEECAELTQALLKCRRFGWFNHHPDRPHSTNIDEAKAEMDDVNAAMERLEVVMRGAKHFEYGTLS